MSTLLYLSSVSGMPTGYASTATVTPQSFAGSSAPATPSGASAGTVYEGTTKGTYYCQVSYPSTDLAAGTLPVVNWSVNGISADDPTPLLMIPGVNVVEWNGTTVGAIPANWSSLSINSFGAVSIQSNVKKNTALAAYLFYMALSSDHISAATGKTITATRSLDGAAFAACTNNPTEIANGWYTIDLAAGDLNANVIGLSFAASGCDDTLISLVTQP